MATKVIRERVSAPFAGSKVDREKGVIRGVLICGAESANGRDYPRGAFGDGTQYEGRPVYADHSRERRVADKVGWFESIRFRANGLPEGDFHVLKSHPLAGQLLEAAERNPALFGFSHVARCKTSAGAGGRERVESVEEVESIDIVAEPATTRGLFEGHKGGKIMATTVRKLCESIVASRRAKVDFRHAAKRLLVLAREADADTATVDDDELGDVGTSEPDSSLRAGFVAAGEKILNDAFSDLIGVDEAVEKIRKLIVTHSELNGNGATGGEEEEEFADESRRRRRGATRESVTTWNDARPGEEEPIVWED